MADPANIKFFWKKLQGSAGSALSATSTASGNYDVDYLQDMMEYTKWKADSGFADPQYITLDLGEGNTGTADCLAIAGHNLATVGATVNLEGSSTGTWGGEEVPIVSGFVTSDDHTLYKEFTSAEYRYWRLKLTGMTAAPEMAICIWGEKTELKRVPVNADPDSQEIKANVNVSETGRLLGNHENYVERKFEVDLTSVDDAMYQKVVEWFEGSHLENFFLAYDTANHPSKCWLMRPDVKFKNPFTTSSLRKVPLRLVGRKEE